jgi:hypothetical protein
MKFIALLADRCFQIEQEFVDFYRDHAVAVYEVDEVHKNVYHPIKSGRTEGVDGIRELCRNEELWEKWGPKPSARKSKKSGADEKGHVVPPTADERKAVLSTALDILNQRNGKRSK